RFVDDYTTCPDVGLANWPQGSAHCFISRQKRNTRTLYRLARSFPSRVGSELHSDSRSDRCENQNFRTGVAPFPPTLWFGVGFVPEPTALQVERESDDALSHLSLPGRGNRRGGTLGPNLESHLSQIRGRLSAQSLSNRSK